MILSKQLFLCLNVNMLGSSIRCRISRAEPARGDQFLEFRRDLAPDDRRQNPGYVQGDVDADRVD